MDTPDVEAIRERVAGFLAGQSSLDDLRLWIMPLLWRIDRQGEAQSFEVASKIALYIAEYGAGHRTQLDFEGALLALASEGASPLPEGEYFQAHLSQFRPITPEDNLRLAS
jgi:hypothetical protein